MSLYNDQNVRTIAGHESLAPAGPEAIQTSEHLQRVANTFQSRVTYPNTRIAPSFRTVSRIISADLGTRIFCVSVGGLDTHASQKGGHNNLLPLSPKPSTRS